MDKTVQLIRSPEFKDHLKSLKSSTEKTIAVFNALQTGFTAINATDAPWKGMAQIGLDDMEFFTDPFVVVPRLYELADWMVYPSKNTNVLLFKLDAVIRILYEIMVGDVVGDGPKVKVYEAAEKKDVDQELTSLCEEWFNKPCGSSGANRGKTYETWVVPKIIFDSLTCGGSAWHKFIGYAPVSPPDEVGELMVHYMDPRSYVVVAHDYAPSWTKIVQLPVAQWGLPKTKAEFDEWYPIVRNRFQHRTLGQAVYNDPVHIDAEDYYWFNPFMWPPMNTILNKVISKLTLTYLQDKFLEKATFPFFIVKVPRNREVDVDDDQFLSKLQTISQLIAQYRAGDVLAIEGEDYGVNGSGEKVEYSEGWEVVPLEIKSGTIDFEAAFRSLNEEIANGMLSSMSQISSIGAQGRSSTLTTGGNINANLTIVRKIVRLSLSMTTKYVLRDVIKLKKNVDKDVSLIDIDFTKTREEDAAQFLNQIISFHGSGALTTNELRRYGARIGMDLPPLPPEMTPEGKAAMGMEEMMADLTFQIPKSLTDINSPEIEMDEVREEIEDQRAQIESNESIDSTKKPPGK
jgi:hypothetical protein